jgi:hypothetical protein
MSPVTRFAVVLLAAVTLALGARRMVSGLGIEVVSTWAGDDREYDIRLSSGLFPLPANAASVDWTLVNTGTQTETARVTVFRHGGGQPVKEVPPGALIERVPAGRDTHNANSVVAGGFELGFLYEVVVETDSRALRPTAAVWSDHGGTVIPGTRIPPEKFIRQEP